MLPPRCSTVLMLVLLVLTLSREATAQYIYFATSSVPVQVARVNTDGTGFTTLLSLGMVSSVSFRGLAVDRLHGYIYVGDTDGNLTRMRLDGTGVTKLLQGLIGANRAMTLFTSLGTSADCMGLA